MKIDIFSSTGAKAKQMDLPASLFEAPVNWGLMHQAVVRQQNNRRQSAAHVKTRGEVQGSTRKLFAQKGTGQARRGPVRSPVLRGGGKAFGPRNEKNFVTDMPRKMRHAALRSCLSLQCQQGRILGLEAVPEGIKTKTMVALLKKMPIEHGRKVLIVSAGAEKSLVLSVRNIPEVTAVTASYLNPESVLNARAIIFTVEAIDVADKMFGKKQLAHKASKIIKTTPVVKEKKEKKAPVKTKKPAAKKASPKKS